jgi:hypothetical protein
MINVKKKSDLYRTSNLFLVYDLNSPKQCPLFSEEDFTDENTITIEPKTPPVIS